MTFNRERHIPIPLGRRLQRLRYSALPMASFVVCVFLAGWLWQRQGLLPNSVGEVEAVRIDVAAGADGIIVPLPRGQWTLFDRVEANDVLVRLDDRAVRAEVATLKAELIRLRGDLAAAAEQIELDEAQRQHDHRRESRRLIWQTEQQRLDVLDRRAAIEADRIEEIRLNEQLTLLEPLQSQEAVSNMEITDLRLQRDEVRKRIEENERGLTESQTQLDRSLASLQEYPQLRTAQAAKLLKPLEAAIAVGERQLDELQVQIDGLVIRAPISGTICEIHSWPGQSLRAGDPVVTLAADQGRYIVSYVRQEQRVRPTVGMAVWVRVHGAGGSLVRSVVERVGPQVELVPVHLQRDPKVEEWGQPVCIRPPANLELCPGQLIDIRFDLWHISNSG
ncbi:MAG: HlyD family efflux transporter periplasmic adaptor subunit [Planctomycetaceae bacterium]|mgnify:CR=1 FL=1|jgi:multidrug resistance efflux pump|nr:HlyD family efflux transporter periplasmic adaptor subunit [Planctomycetaceae bacterium]